jgi:UDP-N-acetylmuramyl pentapeptide phosphotransferase/UDP-N-acetylglucosamine-1-phosphate transferase
LSLSSYPLPSAGGIAAIAAVLAALAMMAWWRNDLIAVICGVAAAALVAPL